MTDGVLAGKTGFTGEAGYCYVGALKREKRTFIVALLACGWPNNRSYKWEDTKKLMEYGLEHFEYQSMKGAGQKFKIRVTDGIPDSNQKEAYTYAEALSEQSNLSFLLADWESVQVRRNIPAVLPAPVREGTEVGTVEYRVNGETLARLPVVIQRSVGKIDFSWCWKKIAAKYFLKEKIY